MKTKMYIFGGKGPDCIKYNDVWIFDTKNTTWHLVSCRQEEEYSPPDGRSGHSMFAFRDKLFVFGGMQQVL
jgi:N-acetylneuraminic acid mutarotase